MLCLGWSLAPLLGPFSGGRIDCSVRLHLLDSPHPCRLSRVTVVCCVHGVTVRSRRHRCMYVLGVVPLPPFLSFPLRPHAGQPTLSTQPESARLLLYVTVIAGRGAVWLLIAVFALREDGGARRGGNRCIGKDKDHSQFRKCPLVPCAPATNSWVYVVCACSLRAERCCHPLVVRFRTP